MEGFTSKRVPRVNYEESDHEEEESIIEVIHEVDEERESVTENGTFGHLNLKKQYRRAFIAAQNRID